MNCIRKKIIIFVLFLGVCFISLPKTETIKVESNEYFVTTSDFEQRAPAFIDASLEFGVPASILMALAIEETSFGTKGVALTHNNWFGTGLTIYPTDPNHKGRFEIYPDYETSVRDAARLLGKPNAYYKVTNIIITNGNLDDSYEDIAKSITNTWCVDEPGKPCSYDAQTLLDDIEKYGLKKYDTELKKLSVDDLKAILDKYYGPNAIAIPGFDKIDKGWNGSYDVPEIDDNSYNSIYLNTSYYGDYTKGYIYEKYSSKPLWDEIMVDTEEEKISYIIGGIFLQGEKLYGDGELHIDDFLFNGTDKTGPGSGWSNINGIPMACKTAVTSSFGYRIHPITGRPHGHSGIDIAAPARTAIYTITDGIVIKAQGGFVSEPFSGTGYGNQVQIKGTDGNTYIYAHMYTTPLVSVGDTVTAGQQIGLVGTSGSSTGNHLHFEVRVNGSPVNPANGFLDTSAIPHC